MKKRFTIIAPPQSINSMYYGNRAHGKTPAAQDWTRIVCHELSSPSIKAKLRELREFFDAEKHAYKLALTFHTPKMFNKQGTISAQSQDLSNIEKGIVDILFLESYFSHVENLNTDDRFLIAMYSQKKYAKTFAIDVAISIVKKPVRP